MAMLAIFSMTSVSAQEFRHGFSWGIKSGTNLSTLITESKILQEDDHIASRWGYTGCIEAALLSKYRNIFDENRTQSSNNSPVCGRRHDSVEVNTKELQRPDAASICADTPLGGPHRT